MPGLMLGTLLLLSSCSTSRNTEIIPPKTFQYSYQHPSRVLTSPDFSKQLSNGKSGRIITVRLDDNKVAKARLGHRYFSANGHNCRKYTVLPSFDYTACQIAGRWYQASPVISDTKS